MDIITVNFNSMQLLQHKQNQCCCFKAKILLTVVFVIYKKEKKAKKGMIVVIVRDKLCSKWTLIMMCTDLCWADQWTGQRLSSRLGHTHFLPPVCTCHYECAWGWPAAGNHDPHSQWTCGSWCECSLVPEAAHPCDTNAAQAWGSLSR